jgi:nucleotide-binding universal stress UspA family protein
MERITAILVATDFSAAAQLAIRRAAQLGQEQQATLEMLHVIEEPLPGEEIHAVETLASAENKLAEIAVQLLPEDVLRRSQVATGKDFVAIIRCARQAQASLIVIGAHGEHTLRDDVFGTTALKLARKASIPLLVVKQPAPAPYRRILAATDFSDASRRALEVALNIAPQAEIDLLHGYGIWGESRLSMAGAGPQERIDYRRQLESSVSTRLHEWLAGINLSGRHIDLHIREGHPATLITQSAVEFKSDLVAMGTTGRSGLPYILLGSVAEKVLHMVPCDTLVVRPPGFRFELP